MVQESANKTIPEREEKQAGKAVTGGGLTNS